MNTIRYIGHRALLAALGLFIFVSAPIAYGQNIYPSRPIKLLVGYAPASGADVVARLIAQKLSQSLKQGVVVENKPGANGVIAAQELVRSPADGYTLLLAAMPQLIVNYITNPNLPYHPLKDFAPVSQVVSADLVLITNPQKVAVNNLKEFIAWSQKQPVTFLGTPGPGTVSDFLNTMFAHAAKAKVESVHFKATGDSVAALLRGDVQALFVTYTVATSLAKAGKVHALAVTGSARSALFPDTPTVKESGYPDLEVGSWYGIFAPTNTPDDVLNKLSKEAVIAVKSPEVNANLRKQGMSLTALNREEFSRSMKNDLAMWEQIVKSTGFNTKN